MPGLETSVLEKPMGTIDIVLHQASTAATVVKYCCCQIGSIPIGPSILENIEWNVRSRTQRAVSTTSRIKYLFRIEKPDQANVFDTNQSRLIVFPKSQCDREMRRGFDMLTKRFNRLDNREC